MPTAIRRRTALALAALCALALPLAGCVRADFGVAVREDGGGDFAITVAVSASQLEDFGVPAEAIVDDALLQAAGADSAAEVTSYRDGDWVGTTARWSEDDAASGLERWTENALFRSVSLTRGDGGWSFEAVAMTAVAVPDDIAEQLDGFGGLDAAQVAAGSEVRFRLALPGALVRHNADEEDGGTLTWLLPSDDGEDVRLFAVTEGGGAPPPPTATPPTPSAAAAGTATPSPVAPAASTPTATPSPTPAPPAAASTPAATPASVATAPSPSPPPEPASAAADGSEGGGGRLAVAAAIALALAALLGLAAWRVRRARAAR